MKSWPLFLKTIILRRPRVANFADIIKVATMFIKTVLEDSKKVKRIKIYVLKLQSTQLAFTCSTLTNQTPKQCLKYVQSE